MTRPLPFAVVVTSIASPNPVMQALAQGCASQGGRFIVIGDVSSPADFDLADCDYYSMQRQLQSDFRLAQLCPTRHYARKNIGYLVAIQAGFSVIVDTDDDNFPLAEFWQPRKLKQAGHMVQDEGWLNVYRYFSESMIWPRGFPLNHVQQIPPRRDTLAWGERESPIQQGLVDENPDVDAIFRLTQTLPLNFKQESKVLLTGQSWCPLNTQNTTFFAPVLPLLYLPAYCSFRMTDIWRGFIAMRIAQVNDWAVTYHASSVRQERNEHNLMQDFEQEVVGYLNNKQIVSLLSKLSLKAGVEFIFENLFLCYEALIAANILPAAELSLLQAWRSDLAPLLDSHQSL